MAKFKLPSNVLTEVILPISTMADEANVFLDPDRGMRFKLVCFVGYVDGVIFFRKESLYNFQCARRASARFEMVKLTTALQKLNTINLINLHFDTDELVLRMRSDKFHERTAEVALMEERADFVKIDESKFEYELVIGIPSVELVHVIADAGVHDFMKIYVKEREIWFKVKNKAVVLHKELGKFVSIGPIFDKPVAAEFSLYRMATFLSALDLTKMVWICWSSDAPPVLIFPLGAFGSFHIYSRLFPDNKWKRASVCPST
ncbi:hypothetical protein SAY87_020471 [Trapa incisa]|uniref:Proliferating cell nuclear antigen PCNA N-terminal domain-containing protein n=1 Tax=Trapa incisa TaxID=236973 RepID=A0AAN7JVT9_9MYRT|nr:hypothetical protein SAY87_020471 [Trapa incisa]